MHDSENHVSTTTPAPTPTATLGKLNITLKTGITEEDIPVLAHINDAALEGDPFKQWRVLFTDDTEYSSTVKAVREAVDDPDYRVIKAVIADPNNPGGEKVIGFIHYLHAGFIELEKVDPFASTTKAEPEQTPTTKPKPKPSQECVAEITDPQDPSSNMAELLAEKATLVERQACDDDEEEAAAAARADRLRRGEVKYVQSRNVYIAAIRGKRHMFVRRLMVLPEYQRKGVAGRLLKIVTDEADRLKIWCWLHSRPAGEKLYEKMGFEALAVFDMDEPELACPEFKSMRRLPRPVDAS